MQDGKSVEVTDGHQHDGSVYGEVWQLSNSAGRLLLQYPADPLSVTAAVYGAVIHELL